MNVLWLQSGGCGGCSMSLLCADTTDFQGHLKAGGIHLLWHPSLSMASGEEVIALLQSVLDIGVGVAVNQATDGVIVALPGSTQNVQVAEPQQIQPTLKVKHGTSVSVFVARDLDFSTVDR